MLLLLSWLVARFPLDVAAEARSLLRINVTVGEDRIERGAQVTARHGLSALRAAVIELPAVDEPPVAVEKKKVGRAGSVVGARRLLAFVIAVRKGEAEFLSHF